MTTLVSSVLEWSFQGSVLILAVLVFRALFQKAPKAVMPAAWAIAAVRLLCPLTLTSAFSLMPTLESTPSDGALTLTIRDETLALPTVVAQESPLLTGWAVLWCVGVAVMLIYTVAAYRRTHRMLREAVRLEGNVYECDRIPTPFIFGIRRPRIYVPSSMTPRDRTFVIAHESAHIARGDHVWKPLGFAVLALHWFNPLVWLGYVLFCRDLELACDERVLGRLGVDVKTAYADALINCAAPRHRIAACPLAFGETDVKRRVRTVLRYRKPSVWLTATAMLACLLMMLCFLTDPQVSAREPLADEPPTTVTKPRVEVDESEVTEPTLVHFAQEMAIDAITPRAVAAGESVMVRVQVKDSRGVQNGVNVVLFCEDDEGAFIAAGEATLTLVQGDAANGMYEGAITVDRGAAAGDYRLRASYLPVSEKPALCTAYTPEGEAAVTVCET